MGVSVSYYRSSGLPLDGGSSISQLISLYSVYRPALPVTMTRMRYKEGESSEGRGPLQFV